MIPDSHVTGTITFREEIPVVIQNDIMDVFFQETVQESKIDALSFQEWEINAYFENYDFEKLMVKYADFFEPGILRMEFEQDTSFYRVNEGRLEVCGIAPSNDWVEVR